MSGPWPQIIICTNFSPLSSPTAPALIRAHFRHTGSQHCYTCGCHFPRLVKFYGEEQKLGTMRAVREWMELGRPGVRAGVMCVVMLSGAVRGRGKLGQGIHLIMLRQKAGGAGWPFEGWTPDPQLIRRCSTPSRKTINNPGSWSDILFIYFVKCSSSSSKS